MKILFFIGSLKLGGAERAVSKHANYWAARGHDISIVTLFRKEADFYTLDGSITRVGLDLMEPRSTLLQKIVLQIRRMWSLSRVIRQIRPDIVISFNTDANILCLQTAVFHPSPVLISERTNPEYQVIKKFPAFLRRVLYIFAPKIVFVSQGVADRYPWIKPDRKTVILNAVEEMAPVERPRNNEIVALGRLMPVKGFDLLIGAFAQIAARHPEWTLAIYGEGPEEGRLRERIFELEMSGRIYLKGKTADPYSVLADAGLFVLSSRYEGFPNALMEAMSMGAPCVSFDCECGPNEIITHEEDGILVPPEDTQALADAISEMLSDPAKRLRLGRKASAINQRLPLEKTAARWEKTIEEITGKKFTAQAGLV